MLTRLPASGARLRIASPDDLAACREAIRIGSKSFYSASLLLPADVREAAFALYGFCRQSDDAVDLDIGTGTTLGTLSRRLDQAYAGTPCDNPIDRAFADTVAACDIPKALPDALLEGFAWDVEGRRYQTLSDLNAYAARVAGTVGAMMAVVMGARTPRAIARATDLGTAMQLTNIARDIGEDARAGRIYAPLDWFDDAGLDPEAFLADPVHDDRTGVIAERLVAAALPLYERGLTGIACLAPGCRAAIRAAGFIYADIGSRLEANAYDAVNHRAFVPKRRKVAWLIRAALTRSEPVSGAPPLPENRFLAEAVHARFGEDDPAAPDPTLADHAIDLVMRLESQDRRQAFPAGCDG